MQNKRVSLFVRRARVVYFIVDFSNNCLCDYVLFHMKLYVYYCTHYAFHDVLDKKIDRPSCFQCVGV